ncbi:MAG: 6-phosphofructokinase, partial [Candidatus Hodarchaeales archaeon]
GRNSGFIALEVALAGGCEEVLIPEIASDLLVLVDRYEDHKKSGKKTNIIVLAEGAFEQKGALWLRDQLESLTSPDRWRVSIIGYIQRGGSPTARDRVLATKLGGYSVDCFADGDSNIMVGEIDYQLTKVSLEEVTRNKKAIDNYILELITILQ